jgi:hypothetical protein
MLAGAAAGLYFLWKNLPVAAPLAIYPEYGYTAGPPPPADPKNPPPAPQSLYTSVQGANQAAIYAQCAGSYPGCTPTMADTQLGL